MSSSRAAWALLKTAPRSLAIVSSNCKTLVGPEIVSRPASNLPPPLPRKRAIPNVKHVLLVGSGKGGVGKSTTADVSGPSIPQLLNLKGVRPQTTKTGDLIGLQNHGVVSMSMGSLVDSGKAIAWRGPMVGKALEQLLFGVIWGNLDVLVVDLPPGTGDTHISLAQRVQVSGALVVTTPQDLALEDVTRSVEMFNKMNIRVCGIVENMSHHVCDGCGKRSYIFGKGGGDKLAQQTDLKVLGHVPLDVKSMEAGEAGAPIVVSDPDSPTSQEYFAMARRLVETM